MCFAHTRSSVQIRSSPMKSKIFQDKLKRRNFLKQEFNWLIIKSFIRENKLSNSFRFKVNNFLSSFPRNATYVHVKNRCILTARSRSTYRHFRMSRLMFRKYAALGQLSGIRKSSW